MLKLDEIDTAILEDLVEKHSREFLESSVVENDFLDAIQLERMHVAHEVLLQALLALTPQEQIDRALALAVSEDFLLETLRERIGVDDDVDAD